MQPADTPCCCGHVSRSPSTLSNPPRPPQTNRLLFHKVRPVFVFDGATPQLKRQTNAARRARREEHSVTLRRTAEKMLMNQIKRHAVELALAQKRRGGGGGGGAQQQPKGKQRKTKSGGAVAAEAAAAWGGSDDERDAFIVEPPPAPQPDASPSAAAAPAKRRRLLADTLGRSSAAAASGAGGSGAGGSRRASGAEEEAGPSGRGADGVPPGRLDEAEQLALALELSLDPKGKRPMPKAVAAALASQATAAAAGPSGSGRRRGGRGGSSSDDEGEEGDPRTAGDAELAAALAEELNGGVEAAGRRAAPPDAQGDAALAASLAAEEVAVALGREFPPGWVGEEEEDDDDEEIGGAARSRRAHRAVGSSAAGVAEALAAAARRAGDGGGRRAHRLLRLDGSAAARTTPGGRAGAVGRGADGGDEDFEGDFEDEGKEDEEEEYEDEGVGVVARRGGGADDGGLIADLLLSRLPDDPTSLDPEVLSTLPQSVQLEVFERIRDAQNAGEEAGGLGRLVGWVCDCVSYTHCRITLTTCSYLLTPQPTVKSLWRLERRPTTLACCRWVVDNHECPGSTTGHISYHNPTTNPHLNRSRPT